MKEHTVIAPVSPTLKQVNNTLERIIRNSSYGAFSQVMPAAVQIPNKSVDKVLNQCIM
jgi:hypothetical protein